ncbi:MAG TPA: nuclear transport factor 2 family protein [Candidatus Nitrosocosmicus sp.]|nr:nuclear transport factor 2 family protein [Candidatus Nitrosocosmicus sp.]
MAINTPEELLNRVTESINNKDLDSFILLYEPEASFIDESGENINGTEKIREKIKGYMDMNGKLESTIRKIIPAGNIVLAYSDWTFKASGPDGNSVNLGGTAIDVLRKQSDNSWLVIIDNPWGIKN